MKPSAYLNLFGHQKDITGLQSILLTYIAVNADDIEQMKLITPKESMSVETMQKINEYETEVRVGQEALARWKNEILVDIPQTGKQTGNQ